MIMMQIMDWKIYVEKIIPWVDLGLNVVELSLGKPVRVRIPKMAPKGFEPSTP